MSQSRTLIYAELLSNIRQVSVIAALRTPADATTNVELSADRQKLFLHHEGETNTLDLPGQVSLDAQLQKPVLGNTELSWRLPLAGQLSRADVEITQTSDAPWSAKHLGGADFSCRECNTIIVQEGTINVWKDLPSENWAEMMEFWHCHKPDAESNGSSGHTGANGLEDSFANRGYGANTKFVATPGTGFVDTTTFLLSKSDCSNLQPPPSEVDSVNYAPVFCTLCNNLIGRVDSHAEGMRLYKWELKTSAFGRVTSTSLEVSHLVAAQLLSLASSQMLSRFILLPLEQQKSFTSSPTFPTQASTVCSTTTSLDMTTMTSSIPLISTPKVADVHLATPLTLSSDQASAPGTFVKLWVLTPTIKYSTSLHKPTSPKTTSTKPLTDEPATPGKLAMKLFWKVVTEDEATLLTDKEGVEDVVLPNKIICELRDSLDRSAKLLPPSSRQFQEWNVGLLDRYEER